MKDEFAFIHKIKPTKKFNASLVIGIGDDAAVYKTKDNVDQVVCTDTLSEHVHFSRSTMNCFQIGWKALAVNISDIAAMGGLPKYYLVSIAVPPNWKEAELLEIYNGMNDIASQFKMDLIGGDTVSSKNDLIITVTVIGEVESNHQLERSNAREGHIVFVTGTVGDAAAGLELLLKQGKEGPFSAVEKKLVQAHQMPKPQIAGGRLLSKYYRDISLNDISDGLASELNEIAEASKVTIEIDEDLLPFSLNMKDYNEEMKLNCALYGGEDYQLVGTVCNGLWETLKDNFEKEEVQITKIGVVTEKNKANVYMKQGKDMTIINKKGYNHFREGANEDENI